MRLTSDKRIWVPDDDDWIRWGADFELDEFNNVMPHIKTTDVALDIGAHVGIWSTRLAERFKRIIAFEPVPKHIECWKQNMLKFTNKGMTDKYHEWGNISKLETVAISDVSGTGIMKVPNVTNSGMASLDHEKKHGRWLQPGWDNFPEVEVETRSLDSFEFDQIDFIKIDVEHLELKVLQGAENTIRKHKPIMYIEIHDPEAYIFMKSLNLGYKMYYSHGMNRLYKIDSSREHLVETNKLQKLKNLMKHIKQV
jgi:FkbM family methyltransferase